MFNFLKRRTKKESSRDAVARVFGDALDIKTVPPDANFFELGGDSITATVVVTALGDAGYNLPSTAVFDHPTLNALVRLIETGGASARNITGPSITLIPRAPDGSAQMQASLLQERLWPFERNPDPTRFQLRGEGAALLRGSLNVKTLEQCLNLIVERHEVLRSSFSEDNKILHVNIHPSSGAMLEHLEAQGDDLVQKRTHAAKLVSHVTSRIFELAHPPPFRCALIRISDDEHVLAVSMHHIISDGWSMGLFVNEIATAYAAYANGQTPRLPDLPYQFADYAAWHREWLSSPAGVSSIDFWRDYLKGLPPALDIPIPGSDGSRKSTFNFPVRRRQIELSPATQSALRDLARTAQTSVHTVFLACILKAFSRLNTIEDLPIGIMHANRNAPGTQNLIGFFATLVHLRFKSGADNPPLSTLIDYVRAETRAIEPNSGVPIGTLIEQGIVDTLPRIFVDSVPRPEMPSIDGLTLEDFPFDHPPLFAVADIALFLFDNGSNLMCLLGTNEDMFSREASDSLAGEIHTSLKDAAADA